MNIILLSGGSGKRLWPLSNDTRSKQFLKLLKNEDGEYESMVQRVYRQIQAACVQSNIVVATSASQVESIKSQLGDHVDIVIEPERRDTFPAIALSSGYLAYEKKLNLNEPVLVLPVDPYADMDYFYTLLKMEKAVQEDSADIVLMGINPTYPSAKYGYILPKKADNESQRESSVYLVEQFIEKPSEEKAMNLIEAGALWNGGIFAFRLGYLLNVVKQYNNYQTYEEVRNNYQSFRKISFDYEVVEKAQSVAMIPYYGSWKDLGTWNTLSEEMDDTCIGYALVGEETTETNIINELSVPVVVLGAKDLIVAASPDGILISDKRKSSYLKPYVDQINLRPMYEECRWGEYKVLEYKQYESGKHSLTRQLHIKAGCSMNYQCHNLRDEIWTIVDGMGDIVLDGHSHSIQCGEVVYINKGQKHDIKAVTDMHIIEVQIGSELVMEDAEYFIWEW